MWLTYSPDEPCAVFNSSSLWGAVPSDVDAFSVIVTAVKVEHGRFTFLRQIIFTFSYLLSFDRTPNALERGDAL